MAWYWTTGAGGLVHRRMNCNRGQLFGCCYDKRCGAAACGLRDMATRRRRLHGVIVTLLRAASTRACTWRTLPPRPVARGVNVIRTLSYTVLQAQFVLPSGVYVAVSSKLVCITVANLTLSRTTVPARGLTDSLFG